MYSVTFPSEGKSEILSFDVSKIGSGATGTIYAFEVFGRKYAAKIFKNISGQTKEKIRSMISMSSELRKKNVVLFDQLTWPIGEVHKKGEIVGFAMRILPSDQFIPFECFFDYNLRHRLPSSEFKSISLLSELMGKLAELLAFLHADGIYVVDLKPQNIRVSKSDLSVFILDCDSFSFKGPDGGAFPAGFVSPDYICPETMRKKLSPCDLGEGQDRYAFAVLVFQVFNRGIHPFQGVILNERIDAPTNDQKAQLGLYAYGTAPHSLISPHPRSVHQKWPNSLRFLLDHAFTGEDFERPSLASWRDFFETLATDKKFRRCVRFPDDPKHIHFSDAECIECYLQTLQNIDGWKPAFPSKPMLTTSPLPPTQPIFAPPSQPIPIVKQKNSSLIWYFLALLVVLIVLGSAGEDTPSTSSSQRPPANASNAAGSGSGVASSSPTVGATANNKTQATGSPRANVPQANQGASQYDVILSRSDMNRLRLSLWRVFRIEGMPPSNLNADRLSLLPLNELGYLREYARRSNISSSTGKFASEVASRLLLLPSQPIELDKPSSSSEVRYFSEWFSYSSGSRNEKCELATAATQFSSTALVFRPQLRAYSIKGGNGTLMYWDLSYPMPFRSWSPITANIDGKNFRLSVEGNVLMPPRGADGNSLSATMTRAMRAGRVMRISGVNSLTHEPLWIDFSLLGFTRAFYDMMSRCNRWDLNVWIE